MGIVVEIAIYIMATIIMEITTTKVITKIGTIFSTATIIQFITTIGKVIMDTIMKINTEIGTKSMTDTIIKFITETTLMVGFNTEIGIIETDTNVKCRKTINDYKTRYVNSFENH